jgi:hypothetical protein
VPSGDAPGAVTNTESGGGGGHGDSTPEPKDPWGEAVEIGTSAPIEPEVKRDNKRE